MDDLRKMMAKVLADCGHPLSAEVVGRLEAVAQEYADAGFAIREAALKLAEAERDALKDEIKCLYGDLEDTRESRDASQAVAAELRKALDDLLDCYYQQVRGDPEEAHDPEEDEIVIGTRKALALPVSGAADRIRARVWIEAGDLVLINQDLQPYSAAQQMHDEMHRRAAALSAPQPCADHGRAK